MAHAHSLYDTDPHFRIDPVTRNIINMSGKVVLIQHDHNSERFTFEIPRYVDGHDMSLCNKTEVHYINGGSKGKNQGLYPVDDLQVDPNDETYVIGSWLISRNATEFVGPLTFMLRFKCETEEVVEYEWGTNIHSGISVGQGINNTEYIAEEYVDILEQWKLDLEKSGVTMTGIEQTVVSTDSGGINEITMSFSDGTVGTFRIQNGDRGFKGDAFTYEDFTPEQLAELKGEKGDVGAHIASLSRTSGTGAPGTTDTYTFSLTNGDKHTFNVYNGVDGKDGRDFKYSDFTSEQLAELKGDPFEYSDFTPEQLATLKGDKGETGSGFKVLGYYTSESQLRSSVTNPEAGDAYGVGSAEPYDIYIYSVNRGWVNNGALQGAKGDDGVTFTPFVDSNGNLSWTNNGGLSNPTTVNIKGDPFTYDDFTEEQLEALTGSSGATIATYGVTTSAELEAAYNDGKIVVCVHEGGVYIMTTRFSATKHSFDSPYTNSIWTIIVENDVWSTAVENSFASEDHSHDIATDTTLGLVMVDGTAGIGVNSENGNLFIKGATTSEIDDKQHSYKPITPENLDYAVKAALVDNANTLSEEEREQVLNWIHAMSSVCQHKDSGDVTELLGSDTRRYIFTSNVTGMPIDNEWWFVDVISSRSTDITITATSILVESEKYIRTACNSVWGDWHRIITADSNNDITLNGVHSQFVEVGGMGLYTNGLGSDNENVWINAAGDAYFTEVNIGTKDNYKKAATEEYVDNAIAVAINNAIGGSY